MENGFSSPRSEIIFPAGLRVLVVDDDPTWLKILEKMLKKCSYEVTTCGLATDALRLLRERKDGFDIVISDVNMPDMDGFKLLEHVGLEMDLPVIMMSVDGETSRVMKGVQHGACDYLLKPIRMKELKNIWQHVFRKKIHEIRDIESHESLEAMMLRSGSDHYEDGHFLGAEDITCSRKRKDSEGNNRHDEKDFGDSSSAKKARVVWSIDLHQKFVKAVNHIGIHKVGPKKILDLMSVPWLTRENVASHLQKYRLYLSRLQKEKEINEPKSTSFAGKSCDIPPKEPPANGNYRFPNNTLIPRGVDHHNKREDDLKPIISETILEPKIPEFVWPEVPEIHKPLLHLENSFTKLPLPDPSSHPKTSTAERGLSANNGHNKTSTKNKRPIYLDYGTSIDSFHEALEPISTSTVGFESSQRRLLTFGSGSSLVAFGEDLQVLPRGDYGSDDFREVGFSEFSDPVISEDFFPIHSCDPMRFGFENPYNYDPNEYASLLTRSY